MGRGQPLHVHLSEQPAENIACEMFYGCSPTRLLADTGVLRPDLTAVHATHLGRRRQAPRRRGRAGVALPDHRTGPRRRDRPRSRPRRRPGQPEPGLRPERRHRPVRGGPRPRDERAAVDERAGPVPARRAGPAATANGYRSLGWFGGGILAEGALADFVVVRDDTDPHRRQPGRPDRLLRHGGRVATSSWAARWSSTAASTTARPVRRCSATRSTRCGSNGDRHDHPRHRHRRAQHHGPGPPGRQGRARHAPRRRPRARPRRPVLGSAAPRHRPTPTSASTWTAEPSSPRSSTATRTGVRRRPECRVRRRMPAPPTTAAGSPARSPRPARRATTSCAGCSRTASPRCTRRARRGGGEAGYGLDVATETRALRLAREVTDEVTFLGGTSCRPSTAPPPRVRRPGDRSDARGGSRVRTLGRRLLRTAQPVCVHGGRVPRHPARGPGGRAGPAGPREPARPGAGGAARRRAGGGERRPLHVPHARGRRRAGRRLDRCDAAARGRVLDPHPYPDARALLDAGVTVALGTDCNPGTCYTSSMPFVIALAVRELRLTPQEALWAATRGAAESLRRDDIGRITVGARGGVTVLDAPSHRHLAYRAGVPLARRLTTAT